MKERLSILWHRLLFSAGQNKKLAILLVILVFTAGGAAAFLYQSSRERNTGNSTIALNINLNSSEGISSAPNNTNVNGAVNSNQNKNSRAITAKNSNSNSGTSSTSTPTAPPAGESPSATVAFYADTQSDTDADNNNHKVVVNYILSSGANPVFHAGDLMEDGTQLSLNYFNDATSTLRATRTFYAAMGNNDRKEGDASTPSQLFLDNFSFPNNERWYSVNIGNLHIIVLDSAFAWSSGTQKSWLLSDLQSAASQSRITGVMYHHPTFSSEIGQTLIDNGADFVVAGHNHSYAHTTSGGIQYFVASGQTSIGYFIVNVYSNMAVLRAYNSGNGLIETINIGNR